MASIKLLCRVLIALVALYATNDGLLQHYPNDGGDFAFRQTIARAAMPVLASHASEDDREIIPVVDGGHALAPLERPDCDRAAVRVSLRLPRVAQVLPAAPAHPWVARGPPHRSRSAA